MRLSTSWSSHLPVLIKVLQISEGPVLELGAGLYSTPVMHWMCLGSERRLVTYENEAGTFEMIRRLGNDLHEIKFVEDWNKIPIEAEHWGVVFVDHAPAERRKIEIAKLSRIADYIVVHDTEAENDTQYEFIKNSFPLFKYKYHYTKYGPHTSVLSNFTDFQL